MNDLLAFDVSDVDPADNAVTIAGELFSWNDGVGGTPCPVEGDCLLGEGLQRRLWWCWYAAQQG